MGPMNSTDWAAMSTDLQAVRDDNAVSIVIRRDATTLAAQTVRVAGVATGRRADSDGGNQAVGAVTVLGAAALDIQVADRFTVAGILYEVEYVHPNRRAKTQARAKAVE